MNDISTKYKVFRYKCFCKKTLLERHLLERIKSLVRHLQFIVGQKHNLLGHLILPRIFPVGQNVWCLFKAWLGQSNETRWVIPEMKSASHFLPQSTVLLRSDSSSAANSSCCRIWDAWSHLDQRVVLSALIEIVQITSSGRSLMSIRKSIGPRMVS